MKVLLTNHHLAEFAGTETATHTLALALRRAGHEAAIAAARLGAVSEMLAANGFEITGDISEWRGRAFDIIHAHHNSMALLARHYFPAVPLVFASHGIMPGLEEPPSIDVGAGRYVAVSEEVKDHWAKLQRWPADAVEIVRNAVDTELYAPKSEPGARLRRILVISNHMPSAERTKVGDAARRLGARARFIGSSGIKTWRIDEEINRADLVVSLGRGAIEGMSSGRAVFIYGRHGGDGFVSAETYEEMRTHNFSGRRFALKLGAEELAEAMSKYSSNMGEVNRRLVLENHDISQLVPQYEQIWREAAERGSPPSPIPIPAQEIEYYQRELGELHDLVTRIDRHTVVKLLRKLRSIGRSALGQKRD